MILEKSKQEAEYQEQLRQKNEELLKLMEQIEVEDQKKLSGWGQKAKKNLEGDQFNDYQQNLQKAIMKLEMKDKTEGSATQLLEQTCVDEDMEARKKRL